MIILGSRVRCKITGYKGTVIAYLHELNGLTEYKVQAGLTADGNFPEPRWFDEVMLEVIEEPANDSRTDK